MAHRKLSEVDNVRKEECDPIKESKFASFTFVQVGGGAEESLSLSFQAGYLIRPLYNLMMGLLAAITVWPPLE